MPLIPVESFPIPALNLSNEELINHISNEFPNLSGSLLMLFNRFRGNKSGVDYIGDNNCMCPCHRDGNEDNVVISNCPKCGTKLEISF
jgi:hypothetical protein